MVRAGKRADVEEHEVSRVHGGHRNPHLVHVYKDALFAEEPQELIAHGKIIMVDGDAEYVV